MPTTSSSNLDKYWSKWVAEHDNEAASYLISSYMPLVTYHVQRISVGLPKSISKDELISHGMIGLYDALEKFDYNRDLKFDTYASFRIRGAILDGLRKEDWLPRSLRDKIKKVDQAIEQLEQQLMRNVTIEEVAIKLQMPTDQVAEIMTEGFCANMLSLEADYDDESEKQSYHYTVEDSHTMKPEDALLRDENKEELAEIISQLNKNEQLVISLFYYDELTLTEIGQVLSLSTSRISQIHSKALFKLRKHIQAI